VVLCVDEKSGIQALDRSQPVLPMMPGVPERRSHDYARHGTTDLFAAFNIADGTVISQLRRHHRAAEFKEFLARIDKNVPAGLEVHMVCDNLATHKAPVIRAWLARHPRFRLHFTPTRLVLDQPGRAVVRLLDRSDDPPRRAQERASPRSRHPRLDRELERQPAPIRLDQDRRRDPGLTGKVFSANFRRGILVRLGLSGTAARAEAAQLDPGD